MAEQETLPSVLPSLEECSEDGEGETLCEEVSDDGNNDDFGTFQHPEHLYYVEQMKKFEKLAEDTKERPAPSSSTWNSWRNQIEKLDVEMKECIRTMRRIQEEVTALSKKMSVYCTHRRVVNDRCLVCKTAMFNCLSPSTWGLSATNATFLANLHQ